MSSITRGFLVWVTVFANASLSAKAFASGFDAPIIGSGQSGPVSEDAAAIFWNPGALGALQGREFFAGGGIVAGHLRYDRQWRGAYPAPDTLHLHGPLSASDIDSTKSGWAAPVQANPLAPTGDVFLAMPMGNRFVFGVGAYVPYAAALDFPDRGAQRFRLQNVFFFSTHVAASAALRLGSGFSVGASLQWVSGLANMKKVQDFAELDEFHRAFANHPIDQPNDFGASAPSTVREVDVLSRPIALQNAFANGLSFNAGAYYHGSRWRMGLSYQHGASMNYRGRFAVDLNDPFFTRDLRAEGLHYPPIVRGSANLAFHLPRRATLGLGLRIFDGLTVDGFVSYVFYSDVDAFEVAVQSPQLAQPALGLGPQVRVVLPRAWHDTMTLQANVRFRLTNSILLSATGGYESPASPDSTVDVASLDGHRLMGGFGAVVRMTSWLDLHTDARIQGILPRTITSSQNDVSNGRYSLLVGYLGGHLQARF